jgi:C4-dicarboxylate transporter DctM subunit
MLVQHLGLVLAMFGAVAGRAGRPPEHPGQRLCGGARSPMAARRQGVFANGSARCSAACWPSQLDLRGQRMEAPRDAGLRHPVWWCRPLMPPASCCSAAPRRALRGPRGPAITLLGLAAGRLAGFTFALHFDGSTLPLLALCLWLARLCCCWPVRRSLPCSAAWRWPCSGGRPAAGLGAAQSTTRSRSIPRCRPCRCSRWPGWCLPAPARPQRLGTLFTALFGGGPTGTVIGGGPAVLFFTAFTGGSGVTILALGGLLLPC